MRTNRWLIAATAALALVPGAVAEPVTSATAGGVAAASHYVLPAAEVDGIPISELSGMAWDGEWLHGVSDRGVLYRFRLEIAGGSIKAIEPVSAAALTDAAGAGARFNAEGLTVRTAATAEPARAELVVALESKPPRIARFSSAGKWLGDLPVPPPADALANYRKKGRGLESVALHPDFGLLTAPESPLKTGSDTLHAVYAQGRSWSFTRHAADSRLKGIEVLPDGSLLVLERSRPGASKDEQVASLRRVDIAGCAAGAICSATLVALLPVAAENFEGLTLIDPRHALIVSDNGGRPGSGTVFALVTLP